MRSRDLAFVRSRGRCLEVKRSTAQELLCVMVMRSRDLEVETGQKQVRNRSETGQKRVRNRSETGQKQVRNRSETGQKQVRNKSETGQKQARNGSETGQKRVSQEI